MVLNSQIISVQEFDTWVHQPENANIQYELIGGEIVEVVSNSKSSNTGLLIGSFITVHVHNHDLGHTTGADGGYQIGDERYIPDMGFIAKARMPKLEDASYISIAPDLALEVISPTDTTRQITAKVANYLAAQTIVWLVYPHDEEVEIYAPTQPMVKLTKNDTLDGGTILPDFKLSLKTIFNS